MTTLKVTTWNIKHLRKAIDGASPREVSRRQAIVREINDIDPDVLCLIEAPGDVANLINWVNAPSPDGLAGRFDVPLVEGTDDILMTGPANVRASLQNLYAMQGTDLTGNQWIWFLVKSDLLTPSAHNAVLQDPQVWRSLVGRSSWPVHYWGDMSERNHKHWRHPQALILNVEGHRLEFI
ncbi:MAG: endonuclease/exonuclease/phosphatase family protein, partial [Woeseiaceae bacterium]